MAFHRECDIPPFFIDVSPRNFSAQIVELGAAPPLNSLRIAHLDKIQAGQVQCQVNWGLTGFLADGGWWNNGCYWEVELLAEQYGPREGVAIPLLTTAIIQAPPSNGSPYAHSATITLPSNMAVGTYKLALSLSFWNPLRNQSVFHAIEDFGPNLFKIIDTP